MVRPSSNNPPYRLLIVDDDECILQGLQDYFSLVGFQVDTAMNGEDAISVLSSDYDIDLVLLDLSMPRMSGFEVLNSARTRGIPTPAIILTAEGRQDSLLKGFRMGAVDYVVKPFNIDELAARVRAILRRTKSPGEAPMDVYCLGDLKINFTSCEAYRNNKRVHFTRHELDLLRYLLENRGHVVTRKQILRSVWGTSADLITRTVDRHVASLRRKIENNREVPDYIETVYGYGYRFTKDRSEETFSKTDFRQQLY